jgi:hypothetical protein
MSRLPKEPLRALSAEERDQLEHVSRSLTMPADQVIHAKEILAVADGHTFTDAANLAGRKSGTVEVTDPDACAKKNSSSRPTR